MIYFDRRTSVCFFFVAVVACVATGAHAASLTAGSENVNAGNVAIAVPVTLAHDAGEDVCAVQLDLSFDSSILQVTSVEAGAVAAQAAKNVVYSELSSGKIRIIAAGFNQNIISPGVVASVGFFVVNGATDGTYPLDLSGALLSDAVGASIACTAVDGSVVVGTGIPEEPDPVGCNGAGIMGGDFPSISLGDGIVMLAVIIAVLVLIVVRKNLNRFHCIA